MKKKNGFFDIGTTDDEQCDQITEESRDAAAPQEKKPIKKQVILILMCSVVLIAAFLLVRNLYYFESSDSMYYPSDWLITGDNDKKPNFKFYEADWDSDILNDREYLDLKGDILYSPNNGSVTVSVGENDYLNVGGKGLKFMADYINSVIAGDHEALNDMFTSDYFDDNEPYESFPQQRLYDIKIIKYPYKRPEYEDTNVNDEYYIVTYKIDRNDGLFRNDIGQEGELAQLFEILIFDS